MKTVHLLPPSLLLLVSQWTSASSIDLVPQSIVIDTDMFSDVDDVGALAIANVLHNCGVADLLGIAINTDPKYGALAASAINTYYGNGHIPIAALKPLSNASYLDTWTYSTGEYASKLAFNFPRALLSASHTLDPVSLYRKLLSQTTTANKITILSIGHLTNLHALLLSAPDDYSSLPGPELLRRSVNALIIMGGEYPGGWEYNLASTPSASSYVLSHWPRVIPITFSGLVPGNAIFSGNNLAEKAPQNSPVLAAYQWYVTRCRTRRESWDPIAVLFGVLGVNGAGWGELGTRPLFRYANEWGYNSVDSSTGNNSWVNDTKVRNQHWLELEEGVGGDEVEWVIDWFLRQGPVVGKAGECHLEGGDGNGHEQQEEGKGWWAWTAVDLGFGRFVRQA